jgi:hypothetical protein
MISHFPCRCALSNRPQIDNPDKGSMPTLRVIWYHWLMISTVIMTDSGTKGTHSFNQLYQ